MNEDDYEEAYDYAKELRGDDDEKDFRWFQRIRAGILLAIVLVFALLALAGCANHDYLALAKACGNGPECKEYWEKWNKIEDRKAQKEREEAPTKACNQAGGVMYCEKMIGEQRCQCINRKDLQRILQSVY